MTETFTVQGMTCGHCEQTITDALRRLDPQARITVDRAAGRVTIDSTLPREALARAIADEGYAVSE